MSLAFAVIDHGRIIGLTGRENEDVYDIRNYIQDIVTRRGYDYKVTITDDREKFFSLIGRSGGTDAGEEEAKDREALCSELESLMP